MMSGQKVEKNEIMNGDIVDAIRWVTAAVGGASGAVRVSYL